MQKGVIKVADLGLSRFHDDVEGESNSYPPGIDHQGSYLENATIDQQLMFGALGVSLLNYTRKNPSCLETWSVSRACTSLIFVAPLVQLCSQIFHSL